MKPVQIPDCAFADSWDINRPHLIFGILSQWFFSALNRVVGERGFSPREIQIVEIDLDLKGLDPQFEGARVLQISDLHMGTWMNRSRLEGIVSMVNDLAPDIIAITGDFISYTADHPLTDIIAPLSRLVSQEGVYAVLGNHDHWIDPEKVRAALNKAGVVVLRNNHRTVTRDSADLHIAGVDDASAGKACLPRLLAQLPDEGPAILLAHEPDFADISALSGRFGLQLSGHTHGGQIVLPFIGSPVLPRFGKKYPAGQYQVGGMVVYTNRGLGTTSLRLRLNCAPEITVFTLHQPG